MAYEVLSNPEKRKLYDQAGEQGIKEGGSGVGSEVPAGRRTWCTSSPCPWRTCTTALCASLLSRRTLSATAVRGSAASLALYRSVPTAGEQACRCESNNWVLE